MGDSCWKLLGSSESDCATSCSCWLSWQLGERCYASPWPLPDLVKPVTRFLFSSQRTQMQDLFRALMRDRNSPQDGRKQFLCLKEEEEGRKGERGDPACAAHKEKGSKGINC